MDQVAREEVPEAPVPIGGGSPQNCLQPAEERQGVQAVEGEAAGERHQVGGLVHRRRGRVGHHVAVHGAEEGRWTHGQGFIFHIYSK